MLKVTADSLDWALTHIEHHGDTDIFPVPFEYKAIRHAWKNVRDYLSNVDLDTWDPRPYRRCLSPKHRYGFRVSTQLDPFDSLLFTALVYDIGPDIERARIASKKKIVFSHRFVPDKTGRFYDPKYTYETFQERSSLLAKAANCKYVIVADIADFYNRLYLHPLENALSACKAQPDHVRVLKKLLSGWNFTISYGVPVGPAASRLLAELAIDDVDRALQSEAVSFCRYSDDYRIFCRSKREAHAKLAFLANVLFENHGLTLQQSKTRVLPTRKFCERYIDIARFNEAESLSKRFHDLMDTLGIDDPYGDIDYDSLDEDDRSRVDALNLQGILNEQLARKGSIDIQITGFVLRRLGQIDDTECLHTIIQKVEHLYAVFPDVMHYLSALRSLDTASKRHIGEKLLALLHKTIIGHLEFHRDWVFEVFTHDTGWNNEKRFASLYTKYPDEFSRRALVLAMGRAKQVHWFKTRKRSVLSLGPWEKRAFLAAASCLPGDEAEHWYKSIKRSLSELESAVVSWARSNPFG